MLSRLIAALWHHKATSTTSIPTQLITRTPWPAAPQQPIVEAGVESQLATPQSPPTQSEVQCNLSRVFLVYSTINDLHRTLFGRYLALPERLRDKVSANMIGTMDSLESIAESLMLADVKLHAQQVYEEYPIKSLDDDDLRETQLDIQEAAEDVQYLRSRVDRVRSTIERLEAEKTECPLMQHRQVDLNAGEKT